MQNTVAYLRNLADRMRTRSTDAEFAAKMLANSFSLSSMPGEFHAEIAAALNAPGVRTGGRPATGDASYCAPYRAIQHFEHAGAQCTVESVLARMSTDEFAAFATAFDAK